MWWWLGSMLGHWGLSVDSGTCLSLLMHLRLDLGDITHSASLLGPSQMEWSHTGCWLTVSDVQAWISELVGASPWWPGSTLWSWSFPSSRSSLLTNSPWLTPHTSSHSFFSPHLQFMWNYIKERKDLSQTFWTSLQWVIQTCFMDTIVPRLVPRESEFWFTLTN